VYFLRSRILLAFILTLPLFAQSETNQSPDKPRQKGTSLSNPVLFVTQVPIPQDFTTIGSTFGNHLPTMASAGRGGDLYIVYPDGTLKNLTALAGFGSSGTHQDEDAIAVRDPAVHWDGQKAIFSMVIGAPEQFDYNEYYWQLYEVTGLGKEDTPVITKVPNQPENTNNIQPTYTSSDNIIFVSDRPRNGARHLYPQLDEYETAPTPSGLWQLDPSNGELFLMNHTPSGAFTPIIDSEGRVIFTRWDHLQRDQQADADETCVDCTVYGTFNYSDESAEAQILDDRTEVFPEPRPSRTDLLAGTNLEGHRFNLFFVWQINQDGTEEEVLNHIGRHELSDYFNRSFNDDNNLVEFIANATGRFNENAIDNFFHPREDPTQAGKFYGIDAPEFGTHAAGQIIAIDGSSSANPDSMGIDYITHRDTADYTDNPGPNHSGLYRDAAPLTDGNLIAIHTPETRRDNNDGSVAAPISRYDFRLKFIVQQGEFRAAGTPLTNGIQKTITYYSPDTLVTYSGDLWELNPVEVVARSRPSATTSHIPATESQVFVDEDVDQQAFIDWMRDRDLAVVVSRNVTTRDQADLQQPYNLRIENTSTQSIGASGKVYDVSHMQFFQGDQLRGIGGLADPRPGRRVLAQAMHDPAVVNPDGQGPSGSVKLGDDGSMAAFVPARRAMSWQLTAPDGTPVVRERYWLTFQPGEVRVCASCHGLNSADQAGLGVPQNPPQAFRDLLQFWKTINCAPGDPDVDQSGSVDMSDLVPLVNALGDPPPQPFDFDCNGQVDQEDFRFAAALWAEE